VKVVVRAKADAEVLVGDGEPVVRAVGAIVKIIVTNKDSNGVSTRSKGSQSY
jgi:hypothetical protein